jgi:condensin complex subunit 3
MSTVEILSGVYDEMDDKTSMVAPLQIVSQLADWTDPRKAVYVGSFGSIVKSFCFGGL